MKITSTTTTATATALLKLLDQQLSMADLQSLTDRDLRQARELFHHWERLAEREQLARRRPAPALTLAPCKPAA
jgi:hypothetical protein